ncbi:MAG: cobalamin-binding protein [SAR86 cluster bacterium]|uniref:Cobalamin-binding protein n=1 Tax=SAR86 cluster bacterium TaxID=2030880 RepID=A0A2A4MHC6_9GAMM|nr:MAG: cobalamin-binding protein [SAR86 cluster bacterium]
MKLNLLALMLTVMQIGSVANAQVIEVIDDRGNSIRLEQAAQRVIALAPHIVEVVYAVGKGDTLVGAVSYSDFPEAAKSIPRVGSYKDFSIESVLRLQPDIILAWDTGNGADKINQLVNLGLTVYWSEPRTLEDVSKSIADIGILLGSTSSADLAASFDATLTQLREQYSHKNRVSVFYQVWNSPLQTLNGEHLISDVMSLCGGHNIFYDTAALAPIVNIESLLMSDPQVIIASGMAQERPEWLDEWLEWPQLKSVVHQQLYFIPPDIIQRHSPRILQGASMMCDQIDRARQVYSQYE